MKKRKRPKNEKLSRGKKLKFDDSSSEDFVVSQETETDDSDSDSDDSDSNSDDDDFNEQKKELQNMIKTLNTLFVTMFGLGKIKIVPGTIGSLATAIILYVSFHVLNLSSNKKPKIVSQNTGCINEKIKCMGL